MLHRGRINKGIAEGRVIKEGKDHCRIIKEGRNHCRIIKEGRDHCRIIKEGKDHCRIIKVGGPTFVQQQSISALHRSFKRVQAVQRCIAPYL